MTNIMELNTRKLFNYLHLEKELEALFSRLFSGWEFADVTMGNETPWECKDALVSKLLAEGGAKVELSDQKGSYVRVFKITINEGFIVNAIYEMVCEPWDEEANIEDDYYYHCDISWERVY